ncbi:MAG: YidC/Oxa1 family membrane protein insertase [Clostridia bacterium]|jgi:YidC/Oxa1 family membrane protein insertase|nr:YidC/Oxa1 family membrane protein insertase [Clostridia bacterium]
MNVLSLLSASQNFIDFAVEKIGSVNLNWIGKLISWLFDIFSGVSGGVIIGVIVFTLCLKTIVLPLDIYSKVKTKKQSLIMEKMRPQMEKLQKQYANDKTMYSQKVMELQKQNGYSPLGACLPMVISLVIFIVVMGAFSTYSNFAIINTYNNMVDAYNASVEVYVQTSTEDTDAKHFLIGENGNYKVEFNSFTEHYCAEKKLSDEEKNSFLTEFNNKTEAEKLKTVGDFVRVNAQRAAADYYYNNNKVNRFGWIGNVWYPDSMLNKVVPDYSKFKSSISRASNGSDTASYEESYNEVTYFLTHVDPERPEITEKKLPAKTYNGYFVLIVLAIGLMFLQQFIMSRTQKATNELSSVDGSAAKTNKWIMIIMPIMFGIFSFFYSAAFSTYMIISTVYGLISTLIINKIVAVTFEKRGDAYLLKKNKSTNTRKRLK